MQDYSVFERMMIQLCTKHYVTGQHSLPEINVHYDLIHYKITQHFTFNHNENVITFHFDGNTTFINQSTSTFRQMQTLNIFIYLCKSQSCYIH